MRSLARPLLAVPSVWPVVAAAQGATGADPIGRSGWNWAIGIAALIVVIVLARLMFARRAARPAGGARGP